MSKPTFYTGLTGKVKIGKENAAEVAYISNWSIENTMEVVEVATLGTPFKAKRAGHKSWTASAEGAIYFGDNGKKGHSALFKAMNNGDEVECEFFLDSGEGTPTRTPVSFFGSGLIESLGVELSAEDKGTVTITISGCGELKYPGYETV